MFFGNQMYRHCLKPMFDRIAAAVLLLLCAPLMAVIAVSVRFYLGSPILFSQTRPGRRGRLFRLYKFRTMTSRLDANGLPLFDADRLTHFGRWLRSTSLDEFPELWNVLRGDMSLVGPRPLLKEYLELYTDEQSRRHQVNPGLTGWAQVHGRNDISWESKFEFDVWYVDHCSFLVDMKILFRTLSAVIFREGISKRGHATSDKFTGGTNLERSSV
jgi:lipopolysaccharide/colanic/teichoic acid biosynthesis glycosyltransferase